MNATGQQGGPGEGPALEDELTAAMAEFAGRDRPPSFSPHLIVRGTARRSRRLAAVAAVAAAAATVVVAAAAGGFGNDRAAAPSDRDDVCHPVTAPAATSPMTARPTAPVGTGPVGTGSVGTSPATANPTAPVATGPASALPTGPVRSGAASALPTGPARSGAPTGTPAPTASPHCHYDSVRVVRRLFTQAEAWENPAIRRGGELGRMMVEFATPSAYYQATGPDGLGITCGQRADGAQYDGHSEVLFFRGTKPLARMASLTFDPASGLVARLGCLPAGDRTGDPTLAVRYGTLVATGEGPGDCGLPVPAAWFADAPTTRGAVRSWTVTFDNGKSVRAGTGNGLIAVTCRK